MQSATPQAAADAIRARFPKADPLGALPDVHPARIPRHVAIIMDGNGRWAQARGLPRTAGHVAGVESVRRVMRAAAVLGVEVLTLYSFSLENWSRPREEVNALMDLCARSLSAERESLIREGIRLRVVGERDRLPGRLVDELDQVCRETDGGRSGTLCLALNYGGRREIASAARSLAVDAAQGRINPETIDEDALASRLWTVGLPDPDLLVRTAGEMRISNFLLWQVSYAEIHVTPKFWPDFGEQDFFDAVRDYASRDRRFGGVEPR